MRFLFLILFTYLSINLIHVTINTTTCTNKDYYPCASFNQNCNWTNTDVYKKIKCINEEDDSESFSINKSGIKCTCKLCYYQLLTSYECTKIADEGKEFDIGTTFDEDTDFILYGHDDHLNQENKKNSELLNSNLCTNESFNNDPLKYTQKRCLKCNEKVKTNLLR